MNARKASRLAALSILAGATSFAACGEKKKPGRPGPAVSLSIQLLTPGNASFGTYCPGTGAILLTIEDADRELTFLYSPSGALHGCPGGPCGDEAIQTAFTAPRKITVEAISRGVQGYAVGDAFDVICRGVADARLPEQIMVGDDLAVEADVKILRVGSINPLFDDGTQHPTTYALAGAPVNAVPPFETLARTATGGGIVFAGGFMPFTNVASAGIFLFDPLALTMRSADETLVNARGGLTATAIADDLTGLTSILFAGGALSTTTSASMSAELYVPGSQPVVFDMFRRRSGHSAVYLPNYRNGGETPRNAVMLIGGCGVGICPGLTSTPPATATMEQFYLRRPSAGVGTAPFCTNTLDQPGVCSDASLESDCAPGKCATPARSLGAAGPLGGDMPRRLYTGQGYEGAGSATGKGWGLSELGFDELLVDGGFHPVFAPAVATLGTNLGMFGGYDTDVMQVAATKFSFEVTQAGDSTLPDMNSPRAEFTATTLLDGRVLVAGGNTATFGAPNYVNTLEILDAAEAAFTYVSLRGMTCDPVNAPAQCEVMAGRRAGHAAVRIDGSLAWTNGAVVIAGGKRDDGTVVPDLFVPAYACEALGERAGLLPEALSGKVDYCDRGRISQKPANPREP